MHLESPPEIKLEEDDIRCDEEAEVEAAAEAEPEAEEQAEAEAVSDESSLDISTDLHDITPPPSPIKRSSSARKSDDICTSVDDVTIKTRKITAKRGKASK